MTSNTKSNNNKEESQQSEKTTADGANPETKKHDSGAADLEKVTDYAEEKEILSTSTDLEDALAIIRK